MAAVIPVKKADEPASFDKKVRQPGLQWMRTNGISLNATLPAKTKLKPYWRECLDDLHESYGGVCAYLCIYIERMTGGGSVDHFVAKSSQAALAYDWDNYRLACSKMNARKNKYDDVLDPFTLEAGTFHLELVTGRIYPNPDLSPADAELAQATIDRLKLDDAGSRELRVRRLDEFLNNDVTSTFLKRNAPFLWSEASRLNLL